MVMVKIFDVKSPAHTVAMLKMNNRINITIRPFRAPLMSEGLSIMELPIVNVRYIST
jgi:hypothetical protein